MVTIQTTKTLDIQDLIENLDIKSKKKSNVEGKEFSITVNRQFLKDCHDALKYYYDKYGDGDATTDDGK